MTTLSNVKRLIRGMSLKDLLALDDELHERIDQEGRRRRAVQTRREAVPGSERRSGEWTFRLEYVKCGKERCKNDRHGPYWYGYCTSGGRTVSKYFGKKLPGEGASGRPRTEKSKAAGGRA